MAFVIDKEYAIFQKLVTVPDEFEDGFGLKTIVAALFMGFLMVPASIYLGLFIGGSMGEAAKWVTVILFSEVAKRSMKSLRQQEIYVLFYMTGIVLSSPASLLWNQYFVRSPAAIAFGVAPLIPSWVAPQKGVLDQYGRTFLAGPWLKPILFMTGMHLIGRIDQFGLGYALYRWTAHVEKLPFPMAPAHALGITALVETRDNSQRWRWRCFSLGAMLGMGWGAIYTGVPAVTSALLRHPLFIVPLPWPDLDPGVEHPRTQFPAVPFDLVFDFGGIIVGMFLPFWMIMGSLLGVVATIIINPVLYHNGLLTTWHPGMGVVDTKFSNHLDFYLSFSIGISLSVFFTSVLPLLKPVFRLLEFPARWSSRPGHQKRLARWLMPMAPKPRRWTLAPHLRARPHPPQSKSRRHLHSYFPLHLCLFHLDLHRHLHVAHARHRGRGISGPLSLALLHGIWLHLSTLHQLRACQAHRHDGYLRGFAPGARSHVYPFGVQRRRHLVRSHSHRRLWRGRHQFPASSELTGTRLGSIIKTDILAFPILIITTVLFSEMIWRMAPIPSEAYPVTQQLWNQRALGESLLYSATLDGSSPFIESIKLNVMACGLGLGVAGYVIMRVLSLPILIFYGLAFGLNAGPGGVVTLTIGALVGKFYFQRKYDPETFKRYIGIVLAGFFGAGKGLIGMGAVALALISKSTSNLGF